MHNRYSVKNAILIGYNFIAHLSDTTAGNAEEAGGSGGNLDDGRASNGSTSGREGAVGSAAGEEDVGLTTSTGGNSGGDGVASDGSGNGDDGETEDEGQEGLSRSGGGGGERDDGAAANGTAGGNSGKSRVGLEAKVERAGGAGALGDESRGESVDAGGVERSAVGGSKGNLLGGVALERGVESLSDEDGASNGQVVLAGDQGSTTEVGRCADALENGGESDELLSGHVLGEVVLALLDRSGTSGSNGAGEKLHVVLLVAGDVSQVGVVCLVEAESQEGAAGNAAESMAVEVVLEVLKSEGELQDGHVDVGTLDGRSSERRGGERQCGGNGRVLHFDVGDGEVN